MSPTVAYWLLICTAGLWFGAGYYWLSAGYVVLAFGCSVFGVWTASERNLNAD